MQLEEFDFDLPSELIAQRPLPERAGSRLLTLDGNTGAMADHRFEELPELLAPGDLLVLNDTRVVRARLFARKSSGGRVELLVERVLDDHLALVMLRASHPPSPGSALILPDGTLVRVLERRGEFYCLEFCDDAGIDSVLQRHGTVPLPPYIERAADAQDEGRYQTVYARKPGAVAAPTAGLHFDETLLARLQQARIELTFITLHVGAGTFQPVRNRRIEDHIMHSERYEVPQETVAAIERTRAAGASVVAVGTTSLRALEAAASGGRLSPGSGETCLFITPGYRFRVVDRLLTNFHLPRSTLLMLAAAFAGLDNLRLAYRHAIAQQYRFFSYGDAMLITRGPALP